LNSRPTVYKTAALPLSYAGKSELYASCAFDAHPSYPGDLGCDQASIEGSFESLGLAAD